MLTSASLDWKWVSSMTAPKLRFKDSEGREFPEWINQRIGEVSIKVISGGTPDTNNARYWNGNINWLTPKEINSKYVKSSLRKISELGNQKSSAKLLPKGTVILTTRASIGLCCIQNTDSSFTTNQGFQSILFNPEKVYSEYGYYFLIRDETQRKMKQLASGSTFLELSPKNLKKLNIPVPSLPEQQKIADFLTAYDTMIDMQSQRVEAMKTRKKGLLQKIFSQEIRFRDDEGKEFPKWEEKKLGEFFSKINKKNNDNLITNVITNSAVNGLIEQRKFFDKDIANKENTDKYYIIEKGDFVYNPRKSNDAPYGPVHMYESDCKGIVSPLYLCFKPIDKTLSLLFMKNYFKSSSWHKYIYANGDTGARDDRVSVKVTTFLDMPVNIPSLPEQQKIADFFTAVDKQIEVEEKRLETMKIIKKGLLQQMFI